MSAVLEALRDENEQRAPLTPLGASYAGRNTAGTTTVVTASNNTDGVALRLISLNSEGDKAEITAGGNTILHVDAEKSNAGEGATVTEKNIRVPAGQKVEIIIGGGDANGYVSYAIL